MCARKLADSEMRDIAEYLETAGCKCGSRRTVFWKAEHHQIVAMCASCLVTVVLPDTEDLYDEEFYHARPV